MGLLTIIRKARIKDRECRLLVLGLDNAGKTTLVRKCKGEPIDEIAPTLGFNIETFMHRGLTINVWDIGGQRSLRSYWRNGFEGTDALIWVVDSTDRIRMPDCKTELHALLLEERLLSASLLIFANKQDIKGAMQDEEIIEALELRSIKSHAWMIQACSAVTGENLLKGFDAVIDDVGKRLYALTPPDAAVAPGLQEVICVAD